MQESLSRLCHRAAAVWTSGESFIQCASSVPVLRTSCDTSLRTVSSLTLRNFGLTVASQNALHIITEWVLGKELRGEKKNYKCVYFAKLYLCDFYGIMTSLCVTFIFYFTMFVVLDLLSSWVLSHVETNVFAYVKALLQISSCSRLKPKQTGIVGATSKERSLQTGPKQLSCTKLKYN